MNVYNYLSGQNNMFLNYSLRLIVHYDVKIMTTTHVHIIIHIKLFQVMVRGSNIPQMVSKKDEYLSGNLIIYLNISTLDLIYLNIHICRIHIFQGNTVSHGDLRENHSSITLCVCLPFSFPDYIDFILQVTVYFFNTSEYFSGAFCQKCIVTDNFFQSVLYYMTFLSMSLAHVQYCCMSCTVIQKEMCVYMQFHPVHYTLYMYYTYTYMYWIPFLL